MFYMLLPSLEDRTSLIAFLRERGMFAVFHYLPLNASEMGERLGARRGDCPVTEDVSDRLVRLPFYNSLKPESQEYVIDVIRSFRAG
jgi:dTDP-4-amino-4,6-dideoxygalactose transaminase